MRGLQLAFSCLCISLWMRSVCGGAAAYKLIDESDLDPEGSVVEVGSDRGEGSTAWLWNLAARGGRDFFSVDFSDEGHSRARRVCGACAHKGLGEDFLAKTFGEVSKEGRISAAYLDNYDWHWGGEHPDSYTLEFPSMVPDEELSQYKLSMRKEYEAEGLILNNANSQEAHLKQAKLVHRLCTPRCMILFDDTFPVASTGKYSGKGGTAIAYLLEGGRFEVVEQSPLNAPSYEGFVMLRRVVGAEEEECRQTAKKPWEENDTGSTSLTSVTVPKVQLQWTYPLAGEIVPCCSFTASLTVNGAVHGEHTVVIFVEHLERFRWTGDGADEGGQNVPDTISFDVSMEKPKHFLLNAHVLSADLKILANSSLDVDLL